MINKLKHTLQLFSCWFDILHETAADDEWTAQSINTSANAHTAQSENTTAPYSSESHLKDKKYYIKRKKKNISQMLIF